MNQERVILNLGFSPVRDPACICAGDGQRMGAARQILCGLTATQDDTGASASNF